MNSKQLVLLASVPLFLLACKKEEPATPPPPAPVTTGTLRLSMEFTNGMIPFDFAGANTDGAGNTIRFTTLKFYISGAKAMDDEGNVVGNFSSAYLLVDAETPGMNTFTLGSMEAGHVHELHFLLGLDETTNRADPTIAAFPLNIPGMHWSWNPTAGYKFVNMEGYVDVNSNGTFDDGTDVSFRYHCAANEAQAAVAPVLRESFIEAHMGLVAGSTLVLEGHVDVAGLLSGVDLLTTPVAMGNGAGNQLLMNNLAASIASH